MASEMVKLEMVNGSTLATLCEVCGEPEWKSAWVTNDGDDAPIFVRPSGERLYQAYRHKCSRDNKVDDSGE